MNAATQDAAIEIANKIGSYVWGATGWKVKTFNDTDIYVEYDGGTYAMNFAKFAPKSAEILKTYDPVTNGNTIQDVITDNIINNGTEEISWSYSYSTSMEQSDTDDISASISASINQSISYGGAASPVAGETQFSLDVSTSYAKTLSKTSSKDKALTIDITVPGKTKYTVAQTKSTGSFSQKTDMTCNFTYGMVMFVPGGDQYHFADEEELFAAMRGYGVDHKQFQTSKFIQKFIDWRKKGDLGWSDKTKSVADLDKIGQTISVITKFDKADNGSLTTTQEKL